MEALGSAAAILQLVQALGTTVVKVHEAYTEITGVQGLLHDFDTQLDGTRMIISVLGAGIEKGSLGTNNESWWRQSDLERLLRSCNQSYQRLNDIFISIARQRSSASAIRAWGRMKLYEADISHLRLCINTCTDALQLPIILHKIVHVQVATPTQERVPDLLEEVVSRLANLESSIAHTKDDLVKRAHQRFETRQPSIQPTTTLQDVIDGIETEISNIAASRRNNSSPTSYSETERRLSKIQSTLSQLRINADSTGENARSVSVSQERLESMEIENDTRSMLSVVDNLVGSVKDYTSTMDGMSTRSKSTIKPLRKGKDIARYPEQQTSENISPSLDLPPIQLPREKHRGIREWVNLIDADDGASDRSGSTSIRSPSPITVTTTTTQSGATTMSGDSFLSEIRQRRIRTIEGMMREKEYTKAMVHLERLFGNENEPVDAAEDARLLDYIAKAIAEAGSDKEEDWYQKFPPLRAKVDERRYNSKLKKDRSNLKRATEAIDQKDHDDAVVILWSYRALFGIDTKEDNATASRVEQETAKRIGLALGQSLFYAQSYWSIPQSILVLENVLENNVLGLTDKRAVHHILARAYYWKPDYEMCKLHGTEACKLMMDTIGRDDVITQDAIRFMALTCSETEDPDMDIWNQMLPEPAATQLMTNKPFEASQSLKSSSGAGRRLAHIQRKPEGSIVRRMILPKLLCIKYYWIRDIYEATGGKGIFCWACLENDLRLGQSSANEYSQGSIPCKNHDFRLNWTSGFNLIHLLAISKPNLKSNDGETANGKAKENIAMRTQANQNLNQGFRGRRPSNSQSDLGNAPTDCVEDISLLCHIKEQMVKSPSEFLATEGFALFNLINRPMQFELPRSRRDLCITPVWAAALGENRSTVSFFISLREVDVVRGSSSILLLKRREKNRLGSIFHPTNDGNELKDVLEAILEVFRALPIQVARDLLSCALQQYSHWCFIDGPFLEKVLQKCGEDSADLRTRFFLPVVTSTSTSLLSTFLILMKARDQKALAWATPKDLKLMLASLLRHSRDIRGESNLRNKSIATLIGYIDDALDRPGAIPPDSLGVENKGSIYMWIDMIRMCAKYGHPIDSGTSFKLEDCISRRGGWEIRLSRIQDEVSTITRDCVALQEEIEQIVQSEQVRSKLFNWNKKPARGSRPKRLVREELSELERNRRSLKNDISKLTEAIQVVWKLKELQGKIDALPQSQEQSTNLVS